MEHLGKSGRPGSGGRWWPLCGWLTLLALAPVVQAEEAGQAAVAETAPAKLVDVNEYFVRGNTVLDARAIEEAVYPFLGPQKALSDIEGARDALQKVYQARGYQSVYVELPEQKVEDGIVYLQVSETKVGRVRVVGAKHYSPVEIRDQVPALKEGQVPDFATVQSQLAGLNRGTGRQVMPLVREGQRPGTMDVDLQVEDQNPWRASLGLNNDYSADTEKLRSVASVGYDNLWQLGHSVSLTFSPPPGHRERQGLVRFLHRTVDGSLEPAVLRLPVRQQHRHHRRQQCAGQGPLLWIVGDLHPAGLGQLGQLVFAGVDFKDFKEEVRLGNSRDEIPLKYAPLTFGYNGYRYSEKSQLGLGLNLVIGTRRSFGYGSEAHEFQFKRDEASASFSVLKGDLNFTYTFDNDWQSASKSAFQLASGPLVSNEQYSAGGATSVRGYLAAERTGDEGYLFSQSCARRPWPNSSAATCRNGASTPSPKVPA